MSTKSALSQSNSARSVLDDCQKVAAKRLPFPAELLEGKVLDGLHFVDSEPHQVSAYQIAEALDDYLETFLSHPVTLEQLAKLLWKYRCLHGDFAESDMSGTMALRVMADARELLDNLRKRLTNAAVCDVTFSCNGEGTSNHGE